MWTCIQVAVPLFVADDGSLFAFFVCKRGSDIEFEDKESGGVKMSEHHSWEIWYHVSGMEREG
jgi:hypothetical protein